MRALFCLPKINIEILPPENSAKGASAFLLTVLLYLYLTDKTVKSISIINKFPALHLDKVYKFYYLLLTIVAPVALIW